ncbi:FAD-binding oxidoreductase [Mesorhizobium wenxiniae]|uniref:FAD-binding oxidoreductase n=1 Tax=Mesorhizobium wenxiniae TaxID=2014805 RepID=A0A271K8M1_9HYPH|nr:FAD-binding oxidoreductase [Mesorhizobium wenxiniae]PAP92086.1 FAD-binding oxidoreductase [Mesorhizobium wenxiniae]
MNLNSQAQTPKFLDIVRRSIGDDWVHTADATVSRYGETTLPGSDNPPPAVVYPGSVDEVVAIVNAANETGTQLFPISNGNNISQGSRAPVGANQIVVDLGRRMNRILDFNEDMGIATVEPGVSYQQMHDELVRRGDRFMVDVTSGPPAGSVLGNALDKGAGYTPYADHFAMTCGMEIVLGNGQRLRTGDGALETARNWHMSKYSYGPYLDGLFVQSNYGIVTQAGFWLMPKPPAIRSFAFTFDNDDDLGDIVAAIRPLRMSGFVPTMMRLCNDLWLLASETSHPSYVSGRSITDDERKDLQRAHNLGSWTVSGAFYGASDAQIAPMVERVRSHFASLGRGRYISHEEAMESPTLASAVAAYAGVPSVHEMKQLAWRPGGGMASFTPGVPMDRDLVLQSSRKSREILRSHGLEYLKMYVCGPRFARGLHHLLWNRTVEAEDRAADQAYKALAAAYTDLGLQVGRSPIRYQDFHMSLLGDATRKTCEAIKDVLDPRGIIAPGRYGIGRAATA